MLKKIYSVMILSFVVISSFLGAEIEYDIQDIGTLQTNSSQAIALNNKGQILGWYNIERSNTAKQFFVRDKDGTFHELPSKENGNGWEIDWRYLTNDSKAYGTFDGNASFAVLYMWEQKNGVVKLGNLPGKDISAINDAGQVLIKSVIDNENGKSIRRPVIWNNGKITKLNGLEGDLGILSEESYGYDMNNKGEVVGQSLTYLVYKNEIYKQLHATKWINGHAIDLHQTVPKVSESCAIAINDNGEMLIKSGKWTLYIYEKNGTSRNVADWFQKFNNSYISGSDVVMDKNGQLIASFGMINPKITEDLDSIWMKITKILAVNDNGKIIANGETIYGERHAMLLVPLNNP